MADSIFSLLTVRVASFAQDGILKETGKLAV